MHYVNDKVPQILQSRDFGPESQISAPSEGPNRRRWTLRCSSDSARLQTANNSYIIYRSAEGAAAKKQSAPESFQFSSAGDNGANNEKLSRYRLLPDAETQTHMKSV